MSARCGFGAPDILRGLAVYPGAIGAGWTPSPRDAGARRAAVQPAGEIYRPIPSDYVVRDR